MHNIFLEKTQLVCIIMNIQDPWNQYLTQNITLNAAKIKKKKKKDTLVPSRIFYRTMWAVLLGLLVPFNYPSFSYILPNFLIKIHDRILHQIYPHQSMSFKISNLACPFLWLFFLLFSLFLKKKINKSWAYNFNCVFKVDSRISRRIHII